MHFNEFWFSFSSNCFQKWLSCLLVFCLLLHSFCFTFLWADGLEWKSFLVTFTFVQTLIDRGLWPFEFWSRKRNAFCEKSFSVKACIPRSYKACMYIFSWAYFFLNWHFFTSPHKINSLLNKKTWKWRRLMYFWWGIHWTVSFWMSSTP